MLRRVIALIAVFFLLFSFESACIAAPKDVKKPNAGDKLACGIRNILTGWTEIPRYTVDSMATKNLGTVVEDGLYQGVVCALFRTAAGLLDAATFFIPPYDRPLMEPL